MPLGQRVTPSAAQRAPKYRRSVARGSQIARAHIRHAELGQQRLLPLHPASCSRNNSAASLSQYASTTLATSQPPALVERIAEALIRWSRIAAA
jgi:hypothetical protein